MRLVNADPLLEKTAELEAVALEQVRKYEPLDNPREWRTWSAILTERTAFKYDLMDAPTIEAEPIKHGRWISENQQRVFKCSVCGNYLDFDGVNAGRGSAYFCPNCGAKMDDDWEEPEINPCRGCVDYNGRGGCKSNGGCGAKRNGVKDND